jgi:hypothetical protein
MRHTKIVDSAIPIEFRGYYIFDGTPSFSLRDVETGSSWWAHLGQERSGFQVEAFRPLEKKLIVSWNNQPHALVLKEFENSTRFVSLTSTSLSPINQKIYKMSEQLIKTTLSRETSRLVKDHREVKKLRSFLAQNPSVSALHDFLPELGEALDYEEFLEIEFPKVMKSRNEQNTPGWGIDKSVGLEEIEAMIARGASESEMNQLLAEKK